jgi:predicted TIM-barrel fold metal-dependent hydrolase
VPITDIGTLHGVRPSTDLDLTAETLLRLMDRNGVGQALTCSLKAIQFNFTAGNDETLALCQVHDNLHPVAVADPRQYPDCFVEVERCASAGFVAFRFPREYQGWAIANRAFQDLLQATSQTGKPAIVHVPASGDATALLEIACGWDIPVVLAAVSYATLSEALAVLADAPNFYIEAHRLTLPGQVELMVESVGAGRLMFGSWAPMLAQRPSMDMVLASEIDERDKALILGENARRMFRLTEESTQ